MTGLLPNARRIVLAGLLFLSRKAEVAVAAMAEGCIGGIGPTVGLLILIAAAVLVLGAALTAAAGRAVRASAPAQAGSA